jgi:hypothetical protein
VGRYLSCCFDKRVLLGLGVALAAAFVVAPHLAVAALPVLVALVCPLSMLLMMRGMNRSGGHASGPVDSGSGSGDELARLREEADRLQTLLERTGREDEPIRAVGHGPAAGGRA